MRDGRKSVPIPHGEKHLRNPTAEYLDFEPGGCAHQARCVPEHSARFSSDRQQPIREDNPDAALGDAVEIYCLRSDPVLSIAVICPKMRFWLQADESEEDPHSNPNIAIGDARS